MEREGALIQSVVRAFDILEALSNAGGEASLKEISQRTGLNKSTAHGILVTLHAKGYVGQARNGWYTLGLRLIELGNAAVARLELRSQAQDVLRELSDQFQETVHLVTRDGTDVVYVDKVESPQSMRIVSQVGLRLPAVCTGVGKAILAHMPDQETERLLEQVQLKEFTSNTITDKEKLIAHLSEVRARGYALDDEEIMVGLRCVAAPIFDHTGACVGALSVSGPSIRMGPGRIASMIPAVCEAGRRISQRLGYQVKVE